MKENEALQVEIRNLKNIKTKLETEIKQLEKQKLLTQASVLSERKKVNEYAPVLEALKKRRAGLEARLSELNHSISTQEARIEKEEARLIELRKDIEVRLSAAEKNELEIKQQIISIKEQIKLIKFKNDSNESESKRLDDAALVLKAYEQDLKAEGKKIEAHKLIASAEIKRIRDERYELGRRQSKLVADGMTLTGLRYHLNEEKINFQKMVEETNKQIILQQSHIERQKEEIKRATFSNEQEKKEIEQMKKNLEVIRLRMKKFAKENKVEKEFEKLTKELE